jgi:hypothetical protein
MAANLILPQTPLCTDFICCISARSGRRRRLYVRIKWDDLREVNSFGVVAHYLNKVFCYTVHYYYCDWLCFFADLLDALTMYCLILWDMGMFRKDYGMEGGGPVYLFIERELRLENRKQ